VSSVLDGQSGEVIGAGGLDSSTWTWTGDARHHDPACKG